ncbi:MAG TPA: GTPase ObgE [Acidimicrobiales bacterium]|nr:GTPase ObgE [Acidimicrobiales bacterium]
MSDFVDEAQIHAKGGDGGAGSVSFRREAHVSNGGPDGGDGGSGGDVWLVASTSVASLLGFRDHPHRRGENGTHGKGKGRHGSSGRSIEVAVPEGTVVKDRDGTVIADLGAAGSRFRAAAGGRGGRGNSRFLSNKRRAPAWAEQGEHGEERWLNLELKLMADVAIIGIPNAGKSTLISKVSAAKPKIADYPFTTLIPHLGVVRLGDGSRSGGEMEMVLADIPGLVEGASEGRGLGHEFLRHIERARALIVLCDLAPADPNDISTTPANQRDSLIGEIGRFREELLDRPRLLVGSKLDSATYDWEANGMDMAISAATGEGIDEFLYRCADLVRQARASRAEVPSEVVIYKMEPDAICVTRLSDGSFNVAGREAERAVAISDLGAPGAADYVAGELKRIGVDRSLVRAGVREGDTVHVGGFSFTYESDN